MATRREFPADFAAALDRVPQARDRFAALELERQQEWLDWIDRGRGQSGRAGRIEEAIRRLAPPAVAGEEIIEEVPPPPRNLWWLWLLALLLLVVGGLLAWYFLSRGDEKRIVPDVIGQRQQVAETRIHEADLKVLTITGASRRPQGVVFAERPGHGTQVNKGQAVTISISSGPAQATVRDVRNMPQATATALLRSAGLKSQIRRVASTRPSGVVVRQEPLPGVRTLKGSTVVLSVSSGVKPVKVPSVVGLTQGDAVTQLTAAGLKADLNNVSSAEPVGTVVAQKPPSGAEADKGSTVIVNVSKGTGSTTTVQTPTVTTTASARVPAVTSLAQVAALRRIVDAGLRPTVVYVSSNERAGSVIAQAPTSGTVRRGSRVRINVSNGPNPQPAASVPDVAGQDQAAATSALHDAGFKVYVINENTTDQAQDGIVIEQQPKAGSSIPRGSQVTIFVGRFSG